MKNFTNKTVKKKMVLKNRAVNLSNFAYSERIFYYKNE